MIIVFLALISLICGFCLAWGFSVLHYANQVPKGTRSRLLLESFSLLIISLGFFMGLLFIHLVG